MVKKTSIQRMHYTCKGKIFYKERSIFQREADWYGNNNIQHGLPELRLFTDEVNIAKNDAIQKLSYKVFLKPLNSLENRLSTFWT
jgi:hypothetical protein